MPGAVTPRTPPNDYASARRKSRHNHVNASNPVQHIHQLGINWRERHLAFNKWEG